MARDNPNDRILRKAAARSEIKRAFQAEKDMEHAARTVKRAEVRKEFKQYSPAFSKKELLHQQLDRYPGKFFDRTGINKTWKLVKKLGKNLYKRAGSPAAMPEEASLEGAHKAMGGMETTRAKLRAARKKRGGASGSY